MDWKIREDIHQLEKAIRWDGSGWTNDAYSSLLVKSISEINAVHDSWLVKRRFNHQRNKK